MGQVFETYARGVPTTKHRLFFTYATQSLSPYIYNKCNSTVDFYRLINTHAHTHASRKKKQRKHTHRHIETQIEAKFMVNPNKDDIVIYLVILGSLFVFSFFAPQNKKIIKTFNFSCGIEIFHCTSTMYAAVTDLYR